jgi:uncharacterized protein
MSTTFNHTNYPKATIRLKPSKIVKDGIGAFAQKSFKKGEVVVKFEEFEDDNVMSVEEYNKLDKETKELVKAHSTIEIDKLYIPANLNHIKPINYFNHSCNPNIGFDENDNYVAIKNIAKGAELLLDYSFLNSNPDYKMKCSCGSKNCRKVVTGNEWKNKDFVKKSSKYFVSSLREMI